MEEGEKDTQGRKWAGDKNREKETIARKHASLKRETAQSVGWKRRRRRLKRLKIRPTMSVNVYI